MTKPGKQTVTLTVAAFLAAALPHLATMPPPVLLAVLAGPAWRLCALWRGWKPPPLVLRATFTLGGTALVIFAHGVIWGRRVAASLLCVMLSAKMLELFRRRDLRLVAAVSFFVIAAQFLFNQRLIYLPYLVIACWLACLALLEIQREEDGAGGNQVGNWREQWLRAGTLMLLAAPLALTLFIFFPRLAQPLWGLPDNVMDGRTGLSDSMSPGSIANLFMDDRPAFRATFNGPRPSYGELYWRGPVLWNFDGTTWERFFYSRIPPPDLPAANSARYDYEVQLEPHERRWLFTLDYPATRPRDATLTMDFQMLSRRPITRLTAYTVKSEPDFTDYPRLPEQFRRAALRLPDERNPRTLALAARWRSEYGDDHRALINRALEWFNNEPFFYTLETQPLGYHGTDEFLFDLREGYCEYYASAFVVLMRAAGVPARIVTGFQGGYWQAGGEYLLVRNSDAHAWAEVWLEGSGWTRVDPTAAVAPSRIRDGALAVAPSRGIVDWPWLRALRNRYDRLQHIWNQQVLGFDAERQQCMMTSLGFPSVSPVVMVGIMMTVSALFLAAILAVIWRRPRAARAGEAQRLWMRLLRRLQRKGLKRGCSETPLEFATRAGSALPDRQPELVQLALMFCNLHYGQAGKDLLERFRHGVQSFKP